MSLFDHFGVDFSKMRVLLVEDNAFELNLAKKALQELGFETVLVAGDGREAVKLMEYFPQINLIISDWNMPKVTGIELLRIAHKRWPGVPFVMLTGNDSVDHVAEAMREGVFAYILKPFNLMGLRRKIIAAIRRHLAEGGDRADGSDVVFRNAIEQIEAIARYSGDDKSHVVPPEITRFEDAVEALLFSDENRPFHLDELKHAAFAVVTMSGLDGARQNLLTMMVNQARRFAEDVGEPDAVQLEVVKLHAEVIRAVAAGKVKGAGTAGPDLMRGLGMAMEKAMA